MQVQFLGTGDAFGSGGRFQTCIYVRDEDLAFLMDCGSSSLIAMKQFGIDPNGVDAILLTHLHGDHFGGVPFFLLDAQLISKRRRPLLIAGPRGLEQRIRDAQEALFPASSRVELPFENSNSSQGRCYRNSQGGQLSNARGWDAGNTCTADESCGIAGANGPEIQRLPRDREPDRPRNQHTKMFPKTTCL